jgi:hypothetical protein
VNLSPANAAGDRECFNLRVLGDSGRASAQALSGNNGGSAGATGPSVAAHTWVHCAAVFSANNSRTAYTNGVPGAANTTNLNPAPAGITQFNIACEQTSGTYTNRVNGFIAEIAVWNVALTRTEILSIYLGNQSPIAVRPANLVAYYPLLKGCPNTASPRDSSALVDVLSSTINLQSYDDPSYDYFPLYRTQAIELGAFNTRSMVPFRTRMQRPFSHMLVR